MPATIPPLVIRLSPRERAHLEAIAAANSLPFSTWARSYLLSSTGYLPPARKRPAKRPKPAPAP